MEEKFAKSRTERMEKLGFFKKNGMEKLIELLNEYRNDGVEEYLENIKSFKIKGGHYSDLYIISKKFGFIKWLVENEKIDLHEIKQKLGIPSFVWYENGEPICIKEDDDYEQLLMLLAIQDEPINFLISVLK